MARPLTARGVTVEEAAFFGDFRLGTCVAPSFVDDSDVRQEALASWPSLWRECWAIVDRDYEARGTCDTAPEGCFYRFQSRPREPALWPPR